MGFERLRIRPHSLCCFLLASLLPAAGAAAQRPARRPSAGLFSPLGRPAADEVVLHGHLRTMDARRPRAQAMAIWHGRILAVGSDAQIRPWIGPRTRIVNAHGRLVLPGFIDGHVHFFAGAYDLSSVDLRITRSAAEFARKICAYARTLPPGEWITGGNWDEQRWQPARWPTRWMIDGCTRRHPVYVNRYDGHMGLANSLALKLAHISRATPTPKGGVIVHDAQGRPTGIVKDAAQDLVARVIPSPSLAERMRIARIGLRHAAALGVTTIQSMDLSYPQAPRIYARLLARRELTARFYVRQPLALWRHWAAMGVRRGFGGPWITVGSMKAFADGAIGSRTAYLFQPYRDNPPSNPNWRGLLAPDAQPPAKLYRRILGADRAGLQVCVHAIGDAANHMVLDFFQKVERLDGSKDRRFRIEHAQHLIAADIPRFAQLHVIASVQPYHAIDDGRWVEKRIGYERAKTSYAYGSLMRHGARLAFGTDWPVAPLNPLYGIYAAVTRATLDGKHPNGWFPRQKIPLAQAIYDYTMGSAYAGFEEKRLGSLTPGKDADFIILDHNLFHIPPRQIWNVRVLATYVGGRQVWRLGQYAVQYSR